MAAKGEMYTCSIETMEKIEALWVTCGYEAIAITVEEVMRQVKQLCCFFSTAGWQKSGCPNLLH